MLSLNSKSPTIEKKLSTVIENNEINTLSTSDKKNVTPSKIIKTNIVGKRPGPKSKTCVPQLKTEKMTLSSLKKYEIKAEQADDSNNVVSSSKKTKILLLDTNNADITDTIDAESKKIDFNTAQPNEDSIIDSIPSHKNETIIKVDSSGSKKENDEDKITSIQNDDVIVNIESNEIKQTTNLDNFDTGAKFEILEECTISLNHLNEEENKKNLIKVKNVIPEPKEEEDNIQDEELDHEMYEELDHEVYEEEINESSVVFNQTHNTVKSIQEHNKDDNNEDSINLTIGEDDIKLFADEEDTNIEKEDEVIENHTKEETSSIKQHESCHLITASSRSTTGLVKNRHSATEKRSSVGDKPRSTLKENKDISNVKPIVNVSMLKDEKKEMEKQVKDKVEAGNKLSNDPNVQQILNDTSKKNNLSLVRNIWVSGLSSVTKATDLKQLFLKYGKVVGAKVVTNAKTPGARCYGFVTLSSAEDANRSIENLHNTELHGRVISVERAKRDNSYQVTAKSSNSFKVIENSENNQKTKKNEEKKDKREEKRERRPEITINDVKKLDLSTLKHVSKDQNQDPKRSKIVIENDEHGKDKSIESKSNEREKQKLKEHERAIRDEERKRRIEKERQFEIERKQKEEAIRLEKERQKLRIERERIEKEKCELLRLERENQRLERERLQREKEELRRAQEKLEETKRQAILKRAMPLSPSHPSKRHSSSNLSRYEERKDTIRSSRIQPSTDFMNQAPPPPNITSSRNRYEQHSSDSRRMRQSPPPPPPASRPKDSTVNIRYAAHLVTDHHYRNREDRSRKDSSSGSSNRHAYTSYDSNKSSYGMSRNSESNTWSLASVKNSYGTVGLSSGTNNMVINSRPDPWSHNTFRDMGSSIWQRSSQPLPEKWNSTSSNHSSIPISGRNSSSNALYGNTYQAIPNIGFNMPTNYSESRFNSYKMSGMSRKY